MIGDTGAEQSQRSVALEFLSEFACGATGRCFPDCEMPGSRVIPCLVIGALLQEEPPVRTTDIDDGNRIPDVASMSARFGHSIRRSSVSGHRVADLCMPRLQQVREDYDKSFFVIIDEEDR
jgi:hypothetical protein